MNKVQNKKITKKVEGSLKNCFPDSNDFLRNLKISIEKYKFMSSKFNSNGVLLTSSNITVINCINHVISEYGEQSQKRYNHRNFVKDTENNHKNSDPHDNVLWGEIVKDLQEIIILNQDLESDLLYLILTMISQVHEKQSLKITNSSMLQEICLNLISHVDKVDSKIRPLYFRCIASFILGNLNSIAKELFTQLSSRFFKESEKYLLCENNTFHSLECLKYCISGLTNLCYLPSNQLSEDFLAKRFQICGKFLQIFIGCLEKSPSFTDLNPISRFRMQHQCLHGLNYISQRSHGLSVDNIERFLEVLRLYCGFGLFKVTMFSDSGTCGSMTTENEEILVTGLSTDEFGTSDLNTESSYHCRPMKKWEMKTRRLALELLLKVLDKSWKKVSTSIWIQFMPLGACPSRSKFHLVNMLEKEHDTLLRSLIIQAIGQCISNCKEFLITAQHQPVSTTFVSRSQNLACALVDLHNRLLGMLFIDKSSHIRLCILKCLVILIKTAPYHRLKSGLIAKIVTSLRQLYLESSYDQSAIRCAILDCFTALVSLESVSQEMHQLLLEPPKFSEISTKTGTSVQFLFDNTETRNMQPSWLVQLCVRLAHPVLVDRLWTCALSPESWGVDMDPLVTKIISEGNQVSDQNMRCQALMTVSAMLAQHSSLIRPSLDTLKRTLLACLDESLKGQANQTNAILRSYVLRVFSGFLSTLENKKVKRYLGIMQDCQDDNIAPESFHSTFFSTNTTNDELICDWWSSFLQPIVQCLRDENDVVRRSAAQCLCFMCEPVLEFMMESEEMRSYWSILLSMFRDPCVAVCCQAIWSLGYWVAMRPLNTDSIFIRTLIDTCVDLCENAVTDCSFYLVCANAAWTLSNAVEVLVAHNEALLVCCKSLTVEFLCNGLVANFMDVETIRRLMKLFCNLCGLKKAGQVAASARIHENAIRGLGYLCRLINDDLIEHLSREGLLILASETFCKAIQLPDKTGRVKVKWNACLSTSHVFRNGALISNDGIFNLHQLIDVLITSVANDRYFKVRNNSLVSIITLIDAGGRRSLGNEHLLDNVFGPLGEACISVSQKFTIPFSEVHRHCLCLYLLHYTLLKLTSLLTPADLDQMSTKPLILTLLSKVFTEQLPLVWKHLRNLNRSFNKQALLTHTLMLKPSVSATFEEIDLLLSEIHLNLSDSKRWPTCQSNKPAIGLIEQLYRSVIKERIVDTCQEQAENNQNICDSDDDGLMTKRPGACLIFSQIYD